jgi:hypothetical protein
MGCDRAFDAKAEQGGAAAQDLYAVGVGCDPVHCDDGCQWALLPKDFPPFTTVQYYFYRLPDGGVLDLINEALVEIARRLAGERNRRPPLSTASRSRL